MVDDEPPVEIVLFCVVPSARVVLSRIVTPLLLAQPFGWPEALSLPSTIELPFMSTLPATVSAPGKVTLFGAPAPPTGPTVASCRVTVRWAAMSAWARFASRAGGVTPFRTTKPRLVIVVGAAPLMLTV